MGGGNSAITLVSFPYFFMIFCHKVAEGCTKTCDFLNFSNIFEILMADASLNPVSAKSLP